MSVCLSVCPGSVLWDRQAAGAENTRPKPFNCSRSAGPRKCLLAAGGALGGAGRLCQRAGRRWAGALGALSVAILTAKKVQMSFSVSDSHCLNPSSQTRGAARLLWPSVPGCPHDLARLCPVGAPPAPHLCPLFCLACPPQHGDAKIPPASGPPCPQSRYCPFSEFPSDSEPTRTDFRGPGPVSKLASAA